ncbi:T9SS type A sorting domain-containing protein [Flaviaesturariibacter aridisoli]|uniref:T9SS type A sorting domain-containing protein n=1 Tax=Flaviaesturariibacter aridisoli TaxID=2545761 RepID=UPI00140456D2|nr:T9SS type A sorting domain-containing protein [Flaviaesturariibacter aridisoli]
MTQTANGQGCASASISYDQSSICGSDGRHIAMMSGTPGGTFSSSAGLRLNPMSGEIDPAASSVGTYTVHYMIPAAGSCPAVDATTDVTIMPRATVTALPNYAICSGTQVTPNVFASNMPGATFTWTNDNPSIGLPASGTGNIGEFTATNSTDQPQRANIAVYATYTENGVSCTSRPTRFAITVNPVPAVNTISNMTFCSGETTAPFTITGPTTGPGVRYVWTSDNPMIGMPKSGQDVIPSFTALNASGAPMVATVTVTPYYNSGARCSGNPTTFTITVNPSPAGTASFSYAGTPYCPVGSVSPTFTGPTGGTFTASAPGLSISPVSGNVNTSLSTPGTYTVFYTYGNAGGCSFINSTTITINNASAAISYASASYCNGTVGTLFPTITGQTGGTFSAPAGLAINASTGAIDLASSTAGNYNVSYTVNTPSCGNVLVQTQVTIIETPVLNAMPNMALCNGSMTAPLNFISANEPGASITWTNDNPAIGLAASGNGDIAPFMVTNNTNAPIDAFIRVTASITKSGTTCVGRTMVFRIRVYPSATVNPVGNQAVCQSAGATAPISFTNSTGSNTGMTYTWLNNNTGIGLAASGSGNIPSFTPNVGTANILVRVTNSFGCTSGPIGFAYNVNACRTTATGTTGDNATGRNRPAAVTTETEHPASPDMVTSPNPARSQVRVSYKGSNSVTLRVLDVNGNPVKTVRGFSSNNTVNVADLRPGNYVIQLVDERRNTVVQRNFIKL